MKYSIVFSSQTGNTAKLAKFILKFFEKEQCIYIGPPSEKALNADIIFAGFWTDKGNCDKKFATFLKNINHKTVFIFGTAGFGKDQQYYNKILENVCSYLSDSCILAGSYMCQGKMPLAVRKKYENILLEKPNDIQAQVMISNFDNALSHPDEDDLKNLENVLNSISNKFI